MATNSSYKLAKLQGYKDWDIWRIRIRAVLAEKDYISAIRPKKDFPKNTTRDIIDSYNEEREKVSIKATALIRLNLGDSPLIQTKNIEENDAEGLFNRLETLYAPKGFSSEFLIAKELFNTTLEKEKTIENYLTKIRSLTDDLALRNKAIPIEIIAAYTLNNLTRDYNYIIAAINQQLRLEEEIDLDDLFSAIIDESRRLGDIKTPIKDEIALYSQEKFKKKNLKEIKCFKCYEKGHYARKCPKNEETLLGIESPIEL